MNVKSLSDEQLVARLKMIVGRSDAITALSLLKSSEHGKQVAEYLRERMGLLRSLYGRLNPGEPSFVAFVARIQGAEEEVSALLNMMENTEKEKKVLDKEVELCSSELNSRKENSCRSNLTILSSKVPEEGR